MEINLCPYCMEEMNDKTVCPHCHKDSRSLQDVPYALKHNTILHGKYLIGAVLGQGGFGITYIAYDFSLEMKVAIKEYYPRNIASRESNTVVFNSVSTNEKEQWAIGKEQFLVEARKMAKMNDIQSIVSVRETFYDNDTAYIVMDYVPGITLKQLVQKNGALSFKECVKMMMPVIEGLEKAHAAGMIHRDISPDNLMVRPDGKMYLLDMGAAKDLRKNNGQDVPVVKKGFSPIEQFMESGDIGPWSDIYALCATIYYAVYLKTVPNALDRMQQDNLSFKGGRKPLTRKQIEVLEKGLALHKETRIQSASQLAGMLKEFTKESAVNVKLIAGIAGAAAVVCIAAAIYHNAPWQPKVEELGSPNTNLYQDSDYQVIDGQYEYYVDTDFNLYVIAYDEDDKTFYLDQGTVIDEEGGSINIGKDKAYFIHDQSSADGNHDSILQMDYDGSNIETLVEQDGMLALQYVRLSNEKEYLYYLGKTEEESVNALYRYDLETKKSVQLKDEVVWFNTDGKYLYYTTLDGADDYQKCKLYRCFLDGSKDKLLDDKNGLIYGYIVDDNIYMCNYIQESMVKVDESKKNKVETVGGDYSHAVYAGSSVYGDGWFYYYSEDSKEIRRVMPDGTGDTAVTKVEESVQRLNYLEYWLYDIEGEYNSDKDSYNYNSANLIYYDGSKNLILSGADSSDSISISSSVPSVSLKGTSSTTITLTAEGDLPSEYHFNIDDSNSCVETSWEGDWKDRSHDLTITGVKVGSGKIRVNLVDAKTDDVIAHIDIPVEVTE